MAVLTEEIFVVVLMELYLFVLLILYSELKLEGP